MDQLFSTLIKDPLIRAQILAVVRHLVTVAGTALVAHGLANSGMVESLSGFAVTAVSFYLSQADVNCVDQKIQDAASKETK